jgi:hypothetical protein
LNVINWSNYAENSSAARTTSLYTKTRGFFADMLVLGRGDKCINPCRLLLAENLILEENKN